MSSSLRQKKNKNSAGPYVPEYDTAKGNSNSLTRNLIIQVLAVLYVEIFAGFSGGIGK